MKVHSPICKLDVIFGHLIEGLESLFGFLYLKIIKKEKKDLWDTPKLICLASIFESSN